MSSAIFAMECSYSFQKNDSRVGYCSHRVKKSVQDAERFRGIAEKQVEEERRFDL